MMENEASSSSAITKIDSNDDKLSKTTSDYLAIGIHVLEELNQLKSQPIIGLAIEPFSRDNDGDIFTFYGLLYDTNNASKYAKLPFRFKLELTTSDIQVFNQIILIKNHVHSKICTKITFETELRFVPGSKFLESLEACINRYEEIRTLLIELKLRFRDEISRNPRHFKAMKKSALEFSCPITGHLGSHNNTWFPSIKNIRPSYVYQKASELLIPQELLGYEIQLNEKTTSFISESLVKMTKNEFQQQFTNQTKDNKHLWLPLPIQQLKMDNHNVKTFNAGITAIKFTYPGLFTPKTPNYTVVFKICSSLMNSIVIRLLRKDETAVKRNLVRAYYTIHNLLQEYGKYKPKLVELADTMLDKFVNGSTCPAVIPNLGEFLIYLTISQKYKWEDIAMKYQFEADVRNVYKYSKYLKRMDFDKHRRCDEVFEVTKYSRYLTLVHILLLKSASSSFQEVPCQIKNIFIWLNSIKTWKEYFTALNVPHLAIERGNQLIEALNIAKIRLYKRFPRPLKTRHGSDNLLGILIGSSQQKQNCTSDHVTFSNSKIKPRLRRRQEKLHKKKAKKLEAITSNLEENQVRRKKLIAKSQFMEHSRRRVSQYSECLQFLKDWNCN